MHTIFLRKWWNFGNKLWQRNLLKLKITGWIFQAPLNVYVTLHQYETVLLSGTPSCSELIRRVGWNPHLILGEFGRMAGVLQCTLFTAEANACLFDLTCGVLFNCFRIGRKGTGFPVIGNLARKCHVCRPNEFTNIKNQFYEMMNWGTWRESATTWTGMWQKRQKQQRDEAEGPKWRPGRSRDRGAEASLKSQRAGLPF